MSAFARREFLKQSVAASAAGWMLVPESRSADQQPGGALHLAPFRFDVTPLKGHSLCGGWIKPVVEIDDSMEAIGFVLLGAGRPIVLCAVDWVGILNEAHVLWRTTLAQAAGTTPDRVAVHCVHQHNSTFACLDAQGLVAKQTDLPSMFDVGHFHRCLERGAKAVAEAVRHPRPVSHIAHGQAQVKKVASNRRVFRSPDGRVKSMRGSSCKVAELRALPEGLIDPSLRTVAFYDGDKKIAACHYYATHPMSYYGDGRVTSDFAGLARKQRQKEDPGCHHLYFTGCAGNIAAGKYNDGSPPVRPVLTQRLYDGLVQSEADLKPVPVRDVEWRTVDILPPARSDLKAGELERRMANRDGSTTSRSRPSFMLSWLRRLEKKTPIVLSSLRINDVSLLHLPAECFIQYQLRAQQTAPRRFVATAAYGDGGPWYIPVRDEYPHGGYEVSVAFCDPEVDPMLTQGIESLLAQVVSRNS